MAQFISPSSENATGSPATGWFSTESPNYYSAINSDGGGQYISYTGNMDPLNSAFGGAMNRTFNWPATTDPGVNTGFKFRIRWAWNNIVPHVGTTELQFNIAFCGQSHQLLPYDFQEGAYRTTEYTLTSGEVDYFRANGGFSGSSVGTGLGIQVTYSDVFPPFAGSDTVTIDFVEFEIPDDAFVVIGSGGLDIGSGAFGFIGGGTLTLTGAGGVELGGTASVILSVDMSGLYILVVDKRHDTMYARDASEDTIDMKIPRPFGRTYLFGG